MALSYLNKKFFFFFLGFRYKKSKKNYNKNNSQEYIFIETQEVVATTMNWLIFPTTHISETKNDIKLNFFLIVGLEKLEKLKKKNNTLAFFLMDINSLIIVFLGKIGNPM